jgi:hypothetical protein
MPHQPGVPTQAASARSPRRGRFFVLAVGPRAKAAKASLDGPCRCVLRGGALRRAVLERGASSYLDVLASIRRRVRFQRVGPTIPDEFHV